MIHGSALGGLTMAEWEDELERWLKPFLDRLGHKTRQRTCPLYVAGLIGPGDRKSVQPMAERVASGNYDQLHHFIADGVWDATPLESGLLKQNMYRCGEADNQGSLHRRELTKLIFKLVRHFMLLSQREIRMSEAWRRREKYDEVAANSQAS
jgi:DDE superfamily endonuclease